MLTLKKLNEMTQQNLAVALQKQKEKLAEGNGTLRGAMAGIVDAKGRVVPAKCPRLEVARMQGVEAPLDSTALVSFAAGYAHEDFLTGLLRSAGYEELPTSKEPLTEWQKAGFPGFWKEQPHRRELKLDAGPTIWQGTPDFVVRTPDGAFGLEAKSLQSDFGVFKSKQNDVPKKGHLLQVANYITNLGLQEWYLAIGHYFYAKCDGISMPPEVRWFRVFLAGNDFCFEGETGARPAGFNRDEVLAYSQLLAVNYKARTMAPRPTWVSLPDGKKGYDECNYCPARMSNECNRFDVGKLSYEEWLVKLKEKSK